MRFFGYVTVAAASRSVFGLLENRNHVPESNELFRHEDQKNRHNVLEPGVFSLLTPAFESYVSQKKIVGGASTREIVLYVVGLLNGSPSS